MRTIRIPLERSAAAHTEFQVLLQPDASKPFHDGLPYVSKQHGLCTVQLGPDTAALDMRGCWLVKCPVCFVNL